MEEFKKESWKGWNFQEVQKAIKEHQLKADIKELKREIERRQKELKNIKPLPFEEYQKNNSYEDWVRRVRRNADVYDIIENEDSKKVKGD